MKIGIYSNGNNILRRQIESPFYIAQFEHPDLSYKGNLECICTEEALDYDAVILHPHYDNRQGCWDRIMEKIVTHPETYFYIFALFASEREDFFGKQPNLEYVTSHSPLLKNPVEIVLNRLK